MTDPLIQQQYSALLSRVRQPARLIGNELGIGRGFSGDPGAVRVVLAFPDVYEVGISNQAIQILYHLARETRGVEVERTYLPWVDAIAEMRAAGVPLLTMETWSRVASADLLGVTLQHEFNYTNMLELLDLAGIPVAAADRTERHPLVVAGGPAVANFAPMAPFLDAIAVGDGEAIFPEMLAVTLRAKQEGMERQQVKRMLADVSGVFVPGMSDTVTRRVLPRLEEAPYPSSCLVPVTAGVHDRAWVEVARGCSRGCRFCQAGMWYRPVRERSPEKVMAMVSAQLAETGHEELALASLSTTDYSRLGELLAALAAQHPDTRVSLPSLRVDSAAVRLAHLVSPTGPSLTLAPEAGSQRMRDIINKSVTESDVLRAAEEAFRCGYTSLKLYFVIGFPLETDEDVEATAALCLRIKELGRRILGTRAGRLQLSVSVNNFIPKPFTPFQWVGMADRDTLKRRQEILRIRLRKPGVRLALHDVEKSFLEAALARGGVEMAGVIHDAWRAGARFDSWTEEFQSESWRSALAAVGATAEQLATTTHPHGTRLPWHVIQGVVDEAYLEQEWQKATRLETTPDCRNGVCGDCGACVPGIAVDLAGVFGMSALDGRPEPPAIGDNMKSAAAAALEVSGAEIRESGAMALARCRSRSDVSNGGRFLATFAVEGKATFIGHLDKMELFRRAIRRAGGRLALSAGMRPKPLLSLALPLAVGLAGNAELCEFALAETPPPDFRARLARALPAGIRILKVEPYLETRHASARVVAADYEVEVESDTYSDVATRLAAAAGLLAELPSLVMEEQRENKVRRFDLKEYVDTVRVRGEDFASDLPGRAILAFRIRVSPQGSVRPQRVVEALARLADVELHLRAGTRVSIELS